MSGAVDQAQLMRYIDLEKEIKDLESKNVLKTYEVRRKMAVDVNEKLKAKQKELELMVKVTNKEKGEYLELEKISKAEIQKMFKSEADYTAKLTVEQEEFLEARSKEDTCRKEVEALAAQHKELECSVEEIKAPAEKIKKLYEERDNLLSDIFNGEYGSDTENLLEAQYDSLIDKKQRITVANYKWTNALVLLRHATSQLQHAVNKWTEIKGKTSMQEKYSMTTEVRNNLIASIQNVISCQNYLKTIEFPYCKPCEMETLKRAANNIYTDMADPGRHDHAYNCYDVTWRRCCALQQWFESVIDNTISKDLKCVCKEVEEVETKLRAERIRLIREKILESGGDVSGISDADQMKISDEEMNAQGIGIVKPANVEDDNGLQMTQCEEPMPPAPTPLPLNELAPCPSESDLFGNIDSIKEEHAKHIEGFEKTQQMNKARMEQGLQEKLAKARRHKKK
ncbi:hypothetical protein ACF0H5_024165 [Mactra antiquata]